MFVIDNADSKGPSSPAAQPTQKTEQPTEEETATSKLFSDVVNVSEGFQLRTAYKKKVKPSKLDGLLERRVKQFTLEEKQRLERLRQAALSSKTAVAKPAAVKTEGSVKQQPTTTPCVKVEEKEENLQLKDGVVKKLDFDQEHVTAEAHGPDVKPEAAGPDSSTQMEVNSVHGSSEEACARKEVNGEPLANTDLNSKNCITEKVENSEKTQKSETSKKRAYEDVEKGNEQSETGSTEVTHSRTSPLQVNGKTLLAAPPHPNVNSDPSSRDQGDAKEPVKSLMNGNLSQNDASDMCHPPPLKVPKLENHVGEKGDPVSKSEDVAVDTEETVPAVLQSSSPSCQNNKSTDGCSSSDGLKSSVTADVSTKESQNNQTSDTSSSTSQPDVAAAGSTVSTSTPQPGSATTAPQKTKLPAADTKTATSGSAGSMTISKEYSTKDRVSLLRFSKNRKARSGTALPSYRKFVTKSSKKSIFILPNDDLKRLARKAGFREVPIFNYGAKSAPDIWPYPSPRPTFGITWRLVTHLNFLKITFSNWHLFHYIYNSQLGYCVNPPYHLAGSSRPCSALELEGLLSTGCSRWIHVQLC